MSVLHFGSVIYGRLVVDFIFKYLHVDKANSRSHRCSHTRTRTHTIGRLMPYMYVPMEIPFLYCRTVKCIRVNLLCYYRQRALLERQIPVSAAGCIMCTHTTVYASSAGRRLTCESAFHKIIRQRPCHLR